MNVIRLYRTNYQHSLLFSFDILALAQRFPTWTTKKIWMNFHIEEMDPGQKKWLGPAQSARS